jgi:hypothetical protein
VGDSDRLVAENEHDGWRLTVWWMADVYVWWVIGPKAAFVMHGGAPTFNEALAAATVVAETRTDARWPQARVDRLQEGT